MISSLNFGVRGEGADDDFSLGITLPTVGEPEDVHLHAGSHKGDDRVHVLGDARRGVQRDRGPDRVGVLLGNAMTPQEVAAVNLEALILAAVRFLQRDPRLGLAGLDRPNCILIAQGCQQKWRDAPRQLRGPSRPTERA